MRRVLELFLISAIALGSALGAQEENGVLVLDVYSVNVPSDVIHEKGFALWAKALKGGDQSSRELSLGRPERGWDRARSLFREPDGF